MGLKANFDYQDVKDLLDSYIDTIEDIIIANLSYLGELAVANARDEGEYNNITNNLRSSTGYIIVKNGEVLKKAGFDSTGIAEFNEEGGTKGEELALELAEEQKKEDVFTLIVVAGMEYAIYVESKGLNVLTTAEALVKESLPDMIKDLKKLNAYRY